MPAWPIAGIRHPASKYLGKVMRYYGQLWFASNVVL